MSNTRLLRANDAGYRRVQAFYGFKGLPKIGQGCFSTVYRLGADRVLKLTCDTAHYALLGKRLDRINPHFPKVYEDIGFLGMTNNKVAIYGVVMEALNKVGRKGTPARTMADTISNAFNGYCSNNEIFMQEDHVVRAIHINGLEKLADLVNAPDGLADAFKVLKRAVESIPNCSVDFHRDNFMVRPGTGEIVIVDPVYDMNLLEEHMRSF